jgi:hypothetical protein
MAEEDEGAEDEEAKEKTPPRAIMEEGGRRQRCLAEAAASEDEVANERLAAIDRRAADGAMWRAPTTHPSSPTNRGFTPRRANIFLSSLTPLVADSLSSVRDERCRSRLCGEEKI